MIFFEFLPRVCAISLVLIMTACSSTPTLEPDAIEPMVELPAPGTQESIGLTQVKNDPWEGFNRRMYYFNYKFDRYILLPLVDGYDEITPDVVQMGVTNFFSNIGEVNTFINALLQFKGERAVKTAFRFITNSTVGLLGVWDPAKHFGVYPESEDFGQTLAWWGVDAGPYIVLPVLGPSTLRDTIGMAGNFYVDSQTIDLLKLKTNEEYFLNVLESVNTRKAVPFKYYGSGSAFEYELIRFLYLRARELEVKR